MERDNLVYVIGIIGIVCIILITYIHFSEIYKLNNTIENLNTELNNKEFDITKCNSQLQSFEFSKNTCKNVTLWDHPICAEWCHSNNEYDYNLCKFNCKIINITCI